MLLSRSWHRLAVMSSAQPVTWKERWHRCGTQHRQAEKPEPGRGQLDQKPGGDPERCSCWPSGAAQRVSSGWPRRWGSFTALVQYYGFQCLADLWRHCPAALSPIAFHTDVSQQHSSPTARDEMPIYSRLTWFVCPRFRGDVDVCCRISVRLLRSSTP